jgi:competence protein ComEA
MIRKLITRSIAVLALALCLPALAAVDVNKASQAELESIKGIGPGLASKILAARQSGSFKNWDDLVDRVSGVGPGNAARFSQAGLTVAGNAFSGAAAAPTPSAQAATENKKPEKAKKAEKADRP